MNAARRPEMTRCALIMAGGTGGHIFPGIAVAHALRNRGWRVHWLGAPGSMESELVPARGFAFEPVAFGGVRGKGLLTLLLLPWRLLRACAQSIRVIWRVKPDVVIGLGGYITFPGGLMSVLMGKPLLLHEQNSVAGLANRMLAVLARRVFTAFPNVLPKGEWVGNPLRAAFIDEFAAPARRLPGRAGPLRVLVVGGSLGAQHLNSVVPNAISLIDHHLRPMVTHQSGSKQFDELQANYERAAVPAHLTPFIDDMAYQFSLADIIVCRAGASTVTEIAAIGAAALFVPFPSAVDDHQTKNAKFLVDAGGGWLMQQSELTPHSLAAFIKSLNRDELRKRAIAAYALRKTSATDEVVKACEDIVAKERA